MVSAKWRGVRVGDLCFRDKALSRSCETLVSADEAVPNGRQAGCHGQRHEDGGRGLAARGFLVNKAVKWDWGSGGRGGGGGCSGRGGAPGRLLPPAKFQVAVNHLSDCSLLTKKEQVVL